jgi:5-methylcytosine-specific restriction endonuclease McrA
MSDKNVTTPKKKRKSKRPRSAEEKAHENALARQRYAKNPEKKKASVYAWRRRHPESVIKIDHKCYQKNPEKKKARERARYAADPGPMKQNAMAWYEANPEAVRAIRRNRRARERKAEGHHMAKDIARIMEEQRGHCAYCRCSVRRSYHVDHIVPLSKGGTNWSNNIQLTCDTCNLRKRDTDPVEFARRLGRLL